MRKQKIALTKKKSQTKVIHKKKTKRNSITKVIPNPKTIRKMKSKKKQPTKIGIRTKQKTIKPKTNETFEQQKERYETVPDDYKEFVEIAKFFGLPEPNLDIMASKKNSKCIHHLNKKYDALHNDLLIDGKVIPNAIYLNAPHTVYSEIIPHLERQYWKWDLTIMALIPSRNERTVYWHQYIESNLFGTKKRHPCQFGKGLGGYIFHIPLRKTFHFEIDGFPATSEDGKIQHDPSGYKLVFWIGSKYLAGFQEKIYEYYAMYEKKMLTYNEDKRKRMAEKRLIAKNSKIK